MGDPDHGNAELYDLVPIARIFSRPEMACFVSALRAEGVHVFVGAEHHIRAELIIVALGGYLIRVPGAQLDQAMGLIDELCADVESVVIPENLIWRIRALVGFNALLGVAIAWVTTPSLGLFALWAVFGAAMAPVPMTMPGDYRNRKGQLEQMR